MHRLLYVFLVVLMPRLVASAEPAYLRHEHMPMPMDATDVSTSLPLDPTRQYKIIVSSEHTLRPLFQGRCRDIKYWFTTGRECTLPVSFNGALLLSRTSHTKDLAGYFYDTGDSDFYLPRLTFFLWGNGRPLLLRTTNDFSYAIPHANVEIIDMVYQDQQEKRAQQEQQRQEEQARRAQAERERQARAQEAEKVRMALEQEQERAAEQEALATVQEFRQRQQEEDARQELLIQRHDQLQNALEQRRTQFAQIQGSYLREQAFAQRAQRLRHAVTTIVIVVMIVLIAAGIVGVSRRLDAWRASREEYRAAQQREALNRLLHDIQRVKQMRNALHDV